MTLRRSLARLLSPGKKSRLDRELDDEILAHLELAERDAIARGVDPRQARVVARRQFGGIEGVKEEHRDSRSFRFIEAFVTDLRYGFASVLRSPGFSAVVTGVLALGIGANVAMFSVIDAVMLKPLPFADPDRIVRVWEAPRPGSVNATSTLDFLDWKRLGTVFDGLSAEIPLSAALVDTDGPSRLNGKAVTADYFKVFGTDVKLGRTFVGDDDVPGAPPVVVLSHACWQIDFAADPDILQRRPVLDGKAYQVIGVLAPGAFDRDRTKFWKPLALSPDKADRSIHWLTVYGRLRRDVTLANASERMTAIWAALKESKDINDREGTILVQPLGRLLVGAGLQQSLTIAFGAVVLVLLIACANVTNLLLAKGILRRREISVRAALGAGRGRLVAQLLTESLVLCLLGGIAGVVVATLLVRVATPLLAEILPFTAEITLDWRILVFASVVALSVALLAGTLPALRASFSNLAESLNGANRGSSGGHGRIRQGIVIGEVALSLVLVCGALLLFRSLLKLQQLDTGVRMDNIVSMSAKLPQTAYPTPEKAALFYQALVERVRSSPGVLEVGLATHLPLQWIGNGEAILLPGLAKPVRLRFKRVDSGYFKALDIPVLSGRGILPSDTASAPRVVVINQALAATLASVGGMTEPVGKAVRLSTPGYIERKLFLPEVAIVGVIRSERVASPGYPDPAVAYVPIAQAPSPEIRLVVRAAREPASVIPAVRAAVRELDPGLPLGDVLTLNQVRDLTLAGSSRPASLIGAFAAIAVFLAAIGLYGVLSQIVTQQRREIGIRMALGARSTDVLSHVMRNGLQLVVLGLATGMLGTVAITRVLKNQLYEVSPLDPIALTLACFAMTLIGVAAGLLPASRAAGVDPVTALREEG